MATETHRKIIQVSGKPLKIYMATVTHRKIILVSRRPLKEDEVEAVLKDGVLTIGFSKIKQEQAKKIQIQ